MRATRLAATALTLVICAHLVPRPPSRRADPAIEEPRAATPVPAPLTQAHVARRAGDRDAAERYVRAALASTGGRAVGEQALYWFGVLALRRGDPLGRAVLGELIVTAFEPDLRLRAASALVTHARDPGEARAFVAAARRSLAPRIVERTPDGARWKRALERLERRVR